LPETQKTRKLAAMRNYRRYSPNPSYRGTNFGRRRGGDRSRYVVIGIVIAIILLIFAYQRAGKKTVNSNANLSNTNTIAVASTPTPSLTTANCPDPVTGVVTTEKVVALTFDVGKKPFDLSKTVPAVKAANVPAAFFVTGLFLDKENADVEENAADVRAIHDAGFAVYNHSYDNMRFTSPITDIAAQLTQTETLITGITNTTTKPFARIPFGESTPAVIAKMREAGYCGITWTVDGLDTESTATLNGVVSRVEKAAVPGAILMLHGESDLAASATPRIVSDLQAAGYTFVSLEELFRRGKPIESSVTNSNLNSNVNSSSRPTVNQNANTSALNQNHSTVVNSVIPA
jgi:peptidoglycan/xylan/chitin deacetylase (PgdA/CDA1 family)